MVWKKAVDLSCFVFEITKNFPKEEIYGLAQQVRRAAFSVPSNIAEGSVRHSDQEFFRFLNIASGSLAELKTQLIIANKVKIIEIERFNEIKMLIDEIAKMLNSLKSKLKIKATDYRPLTTGSK